MACRTLALMLLAVLQTVSVHADIYRTDSQELIPGTEGITPGPGVMLAGTELSFADLSKRDLTDSRFDFANLANANLSDSTLANANLAGAKIAGASFYNTTRLGFTFDQLASTASYQEKDLEGIQLLANDLTGWDLSGQNLTNSNLFSSTLTGANLSGSNLTNSRLPDTTLIDADLSAANLTNASLSNSMLTNANLSGAVVTGADFRLTPSRGFTHSQLASTASYQANSLQGIGLSFSDLTGWDLSGQDLSDAILFSATLTNVDFSGAEVVGASFGDTTVRGFTQLQLASTASYQAKEMQGIGLSGNALNGWDFGGQNLAGAILKSANLTNANLSQADLTNANLFRSTLTNADLNGAKVANANLDSSTLVSSMLGPDTTYNQWTVFPSGFDPAMMDYVPSAVGDFDANGSLDSADIDLLLSKIHDLDFPAYWLPNEMFDLNNDQLVDVSDVQAWVVDVRQTFLGDADLNGSVEFADFLILSENFGQSGTWNNGDFDTNGTVEFADFLVVAENFGEASNSLATVPEPASRSLLVAALFFVLCVRRAWPKVRRWS